MTPTVRDFRPADAGAVAAIRRAAFPYLVTTAEVVAWETARTVPGRHYRLLVVESAGEVVGSVETGLFASGVKPGQAFLNASVRPGKRRRGAGSALVTAAEEYLAGLGAARVYAWALDEPAALTFAERRGYQRGRPSRVQRLDLTEAPLPPLPPADTLPAGVELRTAADFADDPRPLYEADVECSADEPGGVAVTPPTYEHWLDETWRHPALDHHLTSVVLVDGAVAAYSVAHTDGNGRYWSGMTGAPRAFRGRGLAKLAKNDSLHRARAAGTTEAFTGNDDANSPMLAINAWFGYRLSAAERRCIRDLS